MSPDEFMRRFADCDALDLCRLRRSPRLDGWPRSQDFYVEVARGFFDDDDDNWETRQRFVQILREMLYTDGRTLTALLWIAERASEAPDLYGRNGMNALAGISCYLGFTESPLVPKDELIRQFQKWLEVEDLAHNARSCLAKCANE